MTTDRTTRAHSLKTWPEPFEAILAGRKRFEYRKDDRAFALGDILVLREWDPGRLAQSGFYTPDHRAYTDRVCRVRVTYVLHGGRFGVPKGYVVMGIEPVLPDECSHFERAMDGSCLRCGVQP